MGQAARSGTRRAVARCKNIPSHEAIFNHGLEQLAAVATWLDWAALAALLLMFFQAGFWFFSWLEMRALKDKK